MTEERAAGRLETLDKQASSGVIIHGPIIKGWAIKALETFRPLSLYYDNEETVMDLSQAIARCRAGDRAAYDEVVAAHADRLVAMLSRLLGNLEDARDVAQETFVRAYLHLHRFDIRRPFEPWLYRIGRNLAYNHIRSAGRGEKTLDSQGNETSLNRVKSETKSPFEGVMESERHDNLEKILAELRPEFREVLTLRYMSMLDYEEIAARMEVPLGTVKTWLNRAKDQFRKFAEGKAIF
jgi:RNA polymerase sigma-70 factor (ECF subfamily)